MSIFPDAVFEAKIPARAGAALPLAQEYAYDYENNTLLRREGKAYLVYGIDAVKIWVYFALQTPRGRYLAYSRRYGHDLDKLIGYVADPDVVIMEAQRYVREVLQANPYIQDVRDFAAVTEGSLLRLSFTCITLYGGYTDFLVLER